MIISHHHHLSYESNDSNFEYETVNKLHVFQYWLSIILPTSMIIHTNHHLSYERDDSTDLNMRVETKIQFLISEKASNKFPNQHQFPRMRYLSAYILATLGGNKSPSVKDISDILSSVGIDVDKTLAEKVVAQLSGKNIEELIEEGLLTLRFCFSFIVFTFICFYA